MCCHLKLKPVRKMDGGRGFWSQPMCCFGCFRLVIKLVALVVSKDILVSAYEFYWLQSLVSVLEVMMALLSFDK